MALLALAGAACGPDPDNAFVPRGEVVPDAPTPANIPVANTPEPGGVAATGEVAVVRAVDNVFVPEVVEVSPGTEVIWENRGRNDHNIITEDPAWGWSVEADDFGPGDVARHVFSEPGTFRYYCSIHGTIDVGMPGVVVVSPT